MLLEDLGFQVRQPYLEWLNLGNQVVLQFQHGLYRWTLDRPPVSEFHVVHPRVDQHRVDELIRDPRTSSLRNGELWLEPVLVSIEDTGVTWSTLHDGHHRLVAHWLQYRAAPPFRILRVRLDQVERAEIPLPQELS